MNKKNNSGQVILILLLLITVGLGIGLSIIQRSLTDVSTSSKLEESARAFSAAEAGLEKALSSGTGCSSGACDVVEFKDDNQSEAKVDDSGQIPGLNQPLEYPKIPREEIAQFWLANPSTPAPTQFYNQSSIDIYWGDPELASLPGEKPAIEVTIISFNGTTYLSNKFFYDPDDLRRSENGFCAPENCVTVPDLNTNFGSGRKFYCKTTIPNYCKVPAPTFPAVLNLARVRLLYTTRAHPIALVPLGGCGVGCSLPPQARIIKSEGKSGQTQRTVQLFTLDQVVPFYFDYAIFSAGDISK